MPNLTQIINKEVQYLEPQQLNNPTSIYREIFYQNNDLIYAQLPSSVTKLLIACFENCYNLCYVELPEKLSQIQYGCFQNCKSLNNVILPSTLTELGSYCFAGCRSLSNVDSSQVSWDVNITGGHIFDGTALEENTDGLLLFANDQIALQYCNKHYESTVIIPETVKAIAYNCFYFSSNNTGGLVNVTIPNSVSIINSDAFERQPLLSLVDIGENVSNIETYAFTYCNSLSTLVFRQPKDFKVTLASNAFYNKSSLRDLLIYTDNTIIKNYDWKRQNYNATIYPLADYTGGNA